MSVFQTLSLMLLFGTFLIALVSSLIVVWFSWWLNNRCH